MLPIDRYAYSNGLSDVHPGEKIAFALITLVICLCASNFITSLAVIFIMAGAVIFYAGIPPGFYFKLMTVPMSFLFIGIIAVMVSAVGPEGNYIFTFDLFVLTLGVTAGSLTTAVNLFLKSLGAVSCLYFLSLTTPMVEIILVLRKCHVPAVLVELMSLIYRFIFVLMDTAVQMYTAQSSRLGYRSIKLGYASLSKLITNLFVKSYYRADTLSTTLMSRCYGGELSVLEPDYKISRRNILLLCTVDMALVAISLLLHGGNLFWPII